MKELQKKLKQTLSFYKMDQPQLFPESIVHLSKFVDQIRLKLADSLCESKKQLTGQAVHKLMELISNSCQEMSLHCIVKKIAILHCLVHKSKTKELGEVASRYLFDQINIIINQNLQQITIKQPLKRQSSLQKVQNLIRKLSGSKQRSQSRSGKITIQNQKDKGAIIEIVGKIIKPFCFYLLKISQNYDIYWKVKTNSLQKESTMFWKLINWSKTLGVIINETHRLCRYFKNDLLSLSVYINYLICLDISDYYDIIKRHIEKEAQRWKKQIKQVAKTVLLGKNSEDAETQLYAGEEKYEKIAGQKQLIELREFILEIRNIKQKINYVFGNSMLHSLHIYFTRPLKFTLGSKNTKQQGNMDFILQFFQKQTKTKEKKRQLVEDYSCKFESLSMCDTQETISKESPIKQRQLLKTNSLKNETLNGPQMFENTVQGSLLTKIQKAKISMSKSRLNKFLHQGLQKQKMLNSLTNFSQQQANKIQFRQRDKER